MQITIKRFDTSIPLPEYKTPGAVAFDLSARVETTIAPKSLGYIPLNVAIAIPVGHAIILVARSSLHKRGLMPSNGIGIIDEDYCGDSDEYIATLYNFTDAPVTVSKGDRIMQALVVPYARPEIVEVSALGNADRGGFGTTGH